MTLYEPWNKCPFRLPREEEDVYEDVYEETERRLKEYQQDLREQVEESIKRIEESEKSSKEVERSSKVFTDLADDFSVILKAPRDDLKDLIRHIELVIVLRFMQEGFSGELENLKIYQDPVDISHYRAYYTFLSDTGEFKKGICSVTAPV